jgi:hypothetical protein
MSCPQTSGWHGNTELDRVAIGNQDEARVVWLVADGENSETTPAERVSRIGHLDLFRRLRNWVVDRGINKRSRSIVLHTVQGILAPYGVVIHGPHFVEEKIRLARLQEKAKGLLRVLTQVTEFEEKLSDF